MTLWCYRLRDSGYQTNLKSVWHAELRVGRKLLLFDV